MRTLIVDHEPHARATLRHLREADDSIDEVAIAECGAMAIEMIRAGRPDLLLLDVEIRDMTGFDVLRSLKHTAGPAVIMVAAHEEHAVEASFNMATGLRPVARSASYGRRTARQPPQ